MSCLLYEMKDEKNILKWLNGELSPEELAQFKQTEDYKNYSDIANVSDILNLPNLDVDNAYADFKQRVSNSAKTNTPKVIPFRRSMIFKVAASVILLVSLFFLFNNNTTTVYTNYAENKTVNLPDATQIILNDGSRIAYKSKNFETNRTLTLDGEAFFDVTKKGDFDVKTNHGVIHVLGTSFNIRSRSKDFNVFCYTGTVKVSNTSEAFILKPGEGVRLNTEKKLVKYVDKTLLKPYWMDDESVFFEVPYSEVLEEFERQYNTSFEYEDIDTSVIFTGGFNNNDINSAIQSITLPLNLKFKLKEDTIEIFK